MTTSVIIGSGPAAVGVALALSRYRDQEIIVIDVGARLSEPMRSLVDRLASTPDSKWSAADIVSIRQTATRTDGRTLPTKRSYGSDYPFHDMGQLQGVHASDGAVRSLISGAYGGFSNVWGAQVMPLSAAMFRGWPVTQRDMEPHYRAILSHIPFAGQHDDLAALFPLIAEPKPLPPVHPRTRMVLDGYQRHRARMESLGIIIGHARLAFESGRCTSCGLCQTGCPRSLIYSASQTFDKLIAHGRVRYHDGLIAYRVSEPDHRALVETVDIKTRSAHIFEADRVYIACGALGTTRLILASLKHYDQPVLLDESAFFVLPSLSVRRTPHPLAVKSFALGQFNMAVDLDNSEHDLSLIQFYPADLSFLDAMPSQLSLRIARPFAVELLRHMTIGLGYLPSWASPQIRVVARAPQGEALLPGLEISPQSSEPGRLPMLRQVLRRITQASPYLDLVPVAGAHFVQPSGQSYHFGGSFSHAAPDRGDFLNTDRIGRLKEWKLIHMVDGSVFPGIPASTFALTMMANAHRIAEESVTLQVDKGLKAVAITGARGYVGSVLQRSFESNGWRVVSLVRKPPSDGSDARPYDLLRPPSLALLGGIDTLVHCAWDLSVTRPAEIWRVNVRGTEALLRLAGRAGTRRVIFVSSMAAYSGTTQSYGRAKLECEGIAASLGAGVVRPGLVYGPGCGGMAGSLQRMTRLPVTPLPAGNSDVYTVHEEDLAAALMRLASAPDIPLVPLGIAHPEPVKFCAFVRAIGRTDKSVPHLLPVPWQIVYAALRAGEIAGANLPFRADSLLGLARPARQVPHQREARALGLAFRPFLS